MGSIEDQRKRIKSAREDQKRVIDESKYGERKLKKGQKLYGVKKSPVTTNIETPPPHFPHHETRHRHREESSLGQKVIYGAGILLAMMTLSKLNDWSKSHHQSFSDAIAITTTEPEFRNMSPLSYAQTEEPQSDQTNQFTQPQQSVYPQTGTLEPVKPEGILETYAAFFNDAVESVKEFVSPTNDVMVADTEINDQFDIEWISQIRTVDFWKDLVLEYAWYYGLDPDYLETIILIESGGRPEASSGAANGLFQISPPTFRGIVDFLGLLYPDTLMNFEKQKMADGGYTPNAYESRALNMPEYSASAGAYHFLRDFERFGNDPRLAAAAYNGGPGSIKIDQPLQGKAYLNFTGNPETCAYYDIFKGILSTRNMPSNVMTPQIADSTLYQPAVSQCYGGKTNTFFNLVAAAERALDARAAYDPKFADWRTEGSRYKIDCSYHPDVIISNLQYKEELRERRERLASKYTSVCGVK